MYQPRRLTWKLALRTSLRAIPISPAKEWRFTMPKPEFDRRRNGLAGIGAKDEFENVFIESLPNNFPPLYLEGFHQAQAETLKRHPKNPSVVTSLVGWFYNEPFKFMAAAAADKNSRIVPAQHGGGYGVYRKSPLEKHEARIADSYLVWGWADNGSQGLRNIPSVALSTLVSSHAAGPSRQNDGPVLFMATAHPRYSFRFQSSPVGNQFADYIDWELRFLEAVREPVRQAILLRPYPTDYGWDVRQRISDRFPDVPWDNGSPIHEKMRSSRLVVIDHLSTSVLETLIADIPTLLFWDPQRWEVREDAEQYFAELRSVGMLWDSPEDAAAKLADIFDDPWSWWRGSELQEARRHFVDRYALGQRDWAGSWARALHEESELSKAAAR
jgi:putative transferase (TIGR04331 family)